MSGRLPLALPRRTKDLEDVLRERFRVAEREELLVDPRKLFLVELAGRAVFDKTLVPVRYANISISSLPGKGDLLWRRVECKRGDNAPLLQLLLVDWLG